MAILKVTPEEMNYTATKLWSQISEFVSWQAKLYADVDGMKTLWKGEANQIFTRQIYSFKSEFKALENILNQYAEFLESTAISYNDTEQQLAEMARRLSIINA